MNTTTNAAAAFASDVSSLTRLESLINFRPVRRTRRALGKSKTFRPLRDPRDLAARYLRRFVGGEWHKGGNHVGRLNFGPAIVLLTHADTSNPAAPVCSACVSRI